MAYIRLLFTVLSITLVQSLLSVSADSLQVNNRPIIGILTQKLSYRLEQTYGDKYNSYIAASYVKFVECGGARVVPIWTDQSESYYRDLLSHVNGVVFPGGTTWFNSTGGYAAAGEIIYRIAKEMNNAGDYFPIWAACLGFELLSYLEANRIEHRSDCSSNNQILPLKFKSNFRQSRMFKDAPSDVIEILQNDNVTANFHRYCVTENDMAMVNIRNAFRVISVNKDKTGLEFISSFEHVNYPFYGIQFHAEKNLFEWIPTRIIPHTKNAILVSQYFANFMVNEARKSRHSFPTLQAESQSLIYNYLPTYTGLQKSSYEQCYLFKIVTNTL